MYYVGVGHGVDNLKVGNFVQSLIDLIDFSYADLARWLCRKLLGCILGDLFG